MGVTGAAPPARLTTTHAAAWVVGRCSLTFTRTPGPSYFTESRCFDRSVNIMPVARIASAASKRLGRRTAYPSS